MYKKKSKEKKDSIEKSPSISNFIFAIASSVSEKKVKYFTRWLVVLLHIVDRSDLIPVIIVVELIWDTHRWLKSKLDKMPIYSDDTKTSETDDVKYDEDTPDGFTYYSDAVQEQKNHR